MNIYVYPYKFSLKSNPTNPFIRNFVTSLSDCGLNIVNINPISNEELKPMLCSHHNDTDVYILNWIENLPSTTRLGFLKTLAFILFFYIQKRKSKKFVWIYHNFTAHVDDSLLNKWFRSFLTKKSDLIITLSKEACDKLLGVTQKKVLFYNHPINSDLLNLKSSCKHLKYDILIWGSILRYKGILEFLNYVYDNNLSNKFRIHIIGKCKDTAYNEEILSRCTENITYENKNASFQEIRDLIECSKYVLFPYVGKSTSSSGALIDTVTMGGSSIGPNKGAFKDLRDDAVCFTYTSYENLIDIITKGEEINKDDINRFIRNNSWRSFAESLKCELNKI